MLIFFILFDFVIMLLRDNVFSNYRTKVLLFHEKAFANRTIRLSNRTNLLWGIKKLHPRRSAAIKCSCFYNRCSQIAMKRS